MTLFQIHFILYNLLNLDFNANRNFYKNTRQNKYTSVFYCRRLDFFASVAQMDRALPSEGKGLRFESCRAHNSICARYAIHI